MVCQLRSEMQVIRLNWMKIGVPNYQLNQDGGSIDNYLEQEMVVVGRM